MNGELSAAQAVTALVRNLRLSAILYRDISLSISEENPHRIVALEAALDAGLVWHRMRQERAGQALRIYPRPHREGEHL